MTEDKTSNPNRFRPSCELTEMLIYAVTGGKKISRKEAIRLVKISCIEGYFASGGQVGVDPKEYFGERIEGLTANMARRAGGMQEDSIRVGGDGQFSDQFLQMLPDRIPISDGNPNDMYSKLFVEYHQYAQNTEHKEREWGRLVADETGLSVVNIKPFTRKSANRQRANVVGGVITDRG